MSSNETVDKDRPLILVGPDGRMMHMDEAYLDPSQWRTMETEKAVLMVARPQTGYRKKNLLEKIAVYIDENMAKQLTLRDVAEHCGVSVSTVTQTFRKKTNTTFHQYLLQRRMAAAEHLIRSGVPMEEVNRQVGFGDYSSFYRAFKQVYGISPREYKKKIEEET